MQKYTQLKLSLKSYHVTYTYLLFLHDEQRTDRPYVGFPMQPLHSIRLHSEHFPDNNRVHIKLISFPQLVHGIGPDFFSSVVSLGSDCEVLSMLFFNDLQTVNIG